MQVARWGDSLAVRIPDDVARALQLKEGDLVDLHKLGADAPGIAERAEAIVERRVDPVKRANALRLMREMALPLPAGYRFDRDDANAR